MTAYYLTYITLQVLSMLLAWQQVATPGVMPFGGKGIAHDAAEFAGYKDAHLIT